MTKIYIVMINSDFNEGRGPMRIHKIFNKYEDAYNYIQGQCGIMGCPQNKKPQFTHQWKDYYEESYSGYEIRIYNVVCQPIHPV